MPEAIVGLVVDLAADDAERQPAPAALVTSMLGVKIPRIPIAAGFAALPIVTAAQTTSSVNDL